MPRGRKKTINYQDQIIELEQSIATLRSELKKQEAALKEVKERRAQEEMSRLYEAMQARQLQVDDVLALLDENETKTEEAFASPAHLHIVAN